MDVDRLKKHIKVCLRNMRNPRVFLCAQCPFEDEITIVYPKMKAQFEAKRKAAIQKNKLL